jgi:O-antigen biosynthesis protein WbqP
MYRAVFKRLLDVVASLLVAIALSPLLIIIALAIGIFDPGPVIFRQARVGREGQNFTFYKFRSLPVATGNVPSDALKALDLPWIGRFIRRTNIDELPQLFNILKGDMSIVGPRPPIPSQTELVAMRRANGALSCRPGLTGLAQVSAFDGMSPAEKAVFDGHYAAAISFTGDALIVMRTFGYLLSPPPKY